MVIIRVKKYRISLMMLSVGWEIDGRRSNKQQNMLSGE